MSIPTPGDLANRHAHVLSQPPAPTVATTTAAALGAYHAGLVQAGIHPETIELLVLDAARHLVRAAGLTVTTPGLTGDPLVVTVAPAVPPRPANCRCARTTR